MNYKLQYLFEGLVECFDFLFVELAVSFLQIRYAGGSTSGELHLQLIELLTCG